MRIPFRRLALTSFAALTIFSGCTARSSVVPASGDAASLSNARSSMGGAGVPSLVAPSLQALMRSGHEDSPHAYMSPDISTTTPVVFVSQYNNSSIRIYKQSGTNRSPVGSLFQGLANPSGLFVSSDHLLYVANTGAHNILVFKRGSLIPIRTLNDPNQYPVDVAVDTDGTVYASNVLDTVGRPGSVTIWGPCCTNPSGMLVIPNNSRVLFCALDKFHNLYVNYIDRISSKGKVVEFKGGGGAALPVNVAYVFPGGMEFDRYGHLATSDQRTVTVSGYALPLGTLLFTFGGMGDPLSIALTKSSKYVYVSDPTNGAVYQYLYPSGALVDTISNGLGTTFGATAVATDPSAPL